MSYLNVVFKKNFDKIKNRYIKIIFFYIILSALVGCGSGIWDGGKGLREAQTNLNIREARDTQSPFYVQFYYSNVVSETPITYAFVLLPSNISPPTTLNQIKAYDTHVVLDVEPEENLTMMFQSENVVTSALTPGTEYKLYGLPEIEQGVEDFLPLKGTFTTIATSDIDPLLTGSNDEILDPTNRELINPVVTLDAGYARIYIPGSLIFEHETDNTELSNLARDTVLSFIPTGSNDNAAHVLYLGQRLNSRVANEIDIANTVGGDSAFNNSNNATILERYYIREGRYSPAKSGGDISRIDGTYTLQTPNSKFFGVKYYISPDNPKELLMVECFADAECAIAPLFDDTE